MACPFVTRSNGCLNLIYPRYAQEDEAARLAKQQADAEIQAQIRNKARKPVMHSPPAGLLK